MIDFLAWSVYTPIVWLTIYSFKQIEKFFFQRIWKTAFSDVKQQNGDDDDGVQCKPVWVNWKKKKLKKIKRCSVKKKKTIDYKLQFPVFVCLFARDITSFHILTSTIGKLFSIVVMWWPEVLLNHIIDQYHQ